jgi:TolA-binding protein
LARHRKKLTKKELKEDEVAEFFMQSGEYVREHSKKIAGLVVVALIVVLVVTVALRQRKAAEIEAQGWIARANLDLKQGNIDGAIQSYSTIMDRFRGTWSHSDANFFAANAHFMSGRYDSSLVLFERYLSLSKRREEFTASAKLGVAQCLEELGRYQDAADSYLKVQREHPDDPLAPDAILGAGRCYELAGDLRLAESTYSDLLELYPDSNQANLARMPLLQIQAKLENT